MAGTPRVSVIIPVYNGSDYLGKAIESALGQTYPNVEVIVVNDGSDDRGMTEKAALSYGDRIRYFRKQNGGVASALNAGIREMTGSYFSWLSHDDLYYPRKVEAQIRFMEQFGERPVVLYSSYEFVDSQGTFLRARNLRQIDPARFLVELLVSNPVNGCTVLVPRRCFDEAGLFDETLRTAQDYDMWFRLARRHEFVLMPEVLVKSRVHPNQGSLAMKNFLPEANRLLMNCLEDLTADEMRRYGGGSLSLSYLKAALRFKWFLFPEVAEFARGLSKKHRVPEGWLESLERAALSAIYLMMDERLNPRYWARRLRKPKAAAPH